MFAHHMWCPSLILISQLALNTRNSTARGPDKSKRRRPRKRMLDELIVSTYGDMKRRAKKREEWRRWLPLDRLGQLLYNKQKALLDKCSNWLLLCPEFLEYNISAEFLYCLGIVQEKYMFPKLIDHLGNI